MRRIAITVVAAFALAMPSAALAHYGHPTSGNWEAKEAPTSTPAPEPAGTVESFEGETLTIKLANGSVVAGTVTEGTHLICVTPPTTEPASTSSSGSWAHSSDYSRGRHHGYRGHASWWHHGYGRWNHGYGHHGPYGGGPGHGGSPSVQACETSALTAGATVLGADLHVGSEGATWRDVVLES